MTPGQSTLPAIVVDRASKRFATPRERRNTIKERALHPFSRAGTERFTALRDVSFTVDRGEFFGIVGRNGSGKSTLLKCMAGVYRVDRGAITVAGRLVPFIELGVGFNQEMTALDNIVINGVMMGMSPREAQRRFGAVIEFAELEGFLDLKLKNYSSGMLVRLAFAVMIQVDADILLIDEVLAVGDAAFQQKCFDEFVRIREARKTILLVTHDMGAVHRFCDRALLLERGRIVAVDDPDVIGNRYLEINFSATARDDAEHQRDHGSTERMGDGSAEILDAWFENEAGERATVLPAGGRCSFGARVRFLAAVDDPLFGVVLQNDQRDIILAASTLWSNPTPGRFSPGQEVDYRVSFENLLVPGRYDATPAVARQGGGIAWIDRREKLVSVLVSGPLRTDAVVDLRYEVQLLPAKAPPAEVPS